MMNGSLVPAMRFRDLESFWSEHGRPSPALDAALHRSGFVDWVDRKVQDAVDDELAKRGLHMLDADANYDSEGDWYNVWATGCMYASSVTDPNFVRKVTVELGRHHHYLDIGRHGVRVRLHEPLSDLDLEVRIGDTLVRAMVGEEVGGVDVNHGLVSSVRCYFDTLNDHLAEVAIEEFYKHIDDYMRDEDCWFLVDGTPCEADDTVIYIQQCRGQLDIFGKEAA